MRTRPLLVPTAVLMALALAACGSATKVSNQSSSSAPAASAPAVAAPSAAGPSASSASAAGSSPATAASAGASSPAGSAMAASSGPASAGASAAPSGNAPGAAPAAWKCPSAADTITFASGGDVNIQNLWQKDLLPKFKQQCPNISVKFTFDTHSANQNLDVAKIAAAAKSGQAPDVDVTDNFSEAAAQAGLTETVTAKEIPELSSLNAAALAVHQSAAIPYRGSSVLLAYDSTQVASPPKSLADLLAWIKAHPGKFTYNTPDSGGSGYAFAETVVAAKVAAPEVTKMQTGYDPAAESQWSAGLQQLKSLTPDIYQNVYPNGNQAVLDLLAKGEILMAPVWSDQFLSARQQGQLGNEFKVSQISDPSFTGGAAYIAVIKGSKHTAAANSFVSWLLQPAQQAEMVTKISAFPAIPLTSLPKAAQSGFAGVNTQDLRPNFSSKMQADFKQKWAATVPG